MGKPKKRYIDVETFKEKLELINLNKVNKFVKDEMLLLSDENEERIMNLILRYNIDIGILLLASYRYNNDNIFKMLMTMNVDINKINKYGYTHLLAACSHGKYESVELLLKNSNVDINKENEYGDFPLLEACINKKYSIIKLLLTRKEIDVNKCNKDGWTPLMEICKIGKYNIFRMLLNRCEINVNFIDSYGFTALMLACIHNRYRIVNKLLTYPQIDVNIVDRHKRTALMFACYCGHVKIVRLLLNHSKIDVNISDNDLSTALMISCNVKNHKVVKLLLTDPRVDVNKSNINGFTALMLSRDYEVAKLMLSVPNIDINKTNNYHYTALGLRIISQNFKVASLFIEREDLDITICDKHKRTYLCSLCKLLKVEEQYGTLCEMIKTLIEKTKIDVNKKDIHGNSPLSLACYHKCYPVVELLLMNNNINMYTDLRLSVFVTRDIFHYLYTSGDRDIIKLLMSLDYDHSKNYIVYDDDDMKYFNNFIGSKEYLELKYKLNIWRAGEIYTMVRYIKYNHLKIKY